MLTEKMCQINLESMYVLNNYSNNASFDLLDSIIYSIDTIKIYKLIYIYTLRKILSFS